MHQRAFRAMGCHMLAILDRDDPWTEAQLAAVPAWFEEWEQQLSRFRPDSDLMRLNAAAGRPVAVPPALWDVITVALDAARQSDGLVQPTLLGALEAAGYDRSFDELAPEQATTGAAVRVADWHAIELDPHNRTVKLPEGMRLDLGGVAKGWAADQAVRRLSMAGPALVDSGGDISVSGPLADGQPWPIGIDSPFGQHETLGLLLLDHGAVATSGRDYRRWQRGGVEQHHIIDPRTGRPAVTDVIAATVVAPDGPAAEVAAKVALILGSDAGLAWIEARSSLAGLLVLENGHVLHSRRMAAYFQADAPGPEPQI
jgi:thiamine biosynthesis lipoprotein